MPSISISGFSGISPRTSSVLLGASQAQIASNVKLQSGELRPWRKPLQIFTPVNANVQSIYNLVGPGGSTAWLEWTTDVDVVPGPVADTADFRIYYTGAGSPKKSNWSLATTGAGAKPVAYYEMGVPAPVGAPTLATAGGTAPTEVRAYVYTYISTFGAVTEESAPSPAATITTNSSGSTVTVNGFSAVPGGAYNITGIRIYRTVTGASTVTYQFVAQIPIATTSYADTLTVSALGQALPSLNYNVPPAGMQGLVSMPNGMLAGFVGNQVYFCEPYLPHAWPAAYSLSVEFPIVGLGVYGNTLVVCTTKNPYLITGNSPSAMSQEKLPMLQPCSSKRSIAFDQFGVVYASPNGLVAIGPGIQDLITTPLFTRDDWQKLVPSTMIGLVQNNFYIGFYTVNNAHSAIVMSRNDNPPLTTYDFDTVAIFVERNTGNIFAVSAMDNNVYQLDADPANNVTYTWKSRRYVLPKPLSFAAFIADADFSYLNDAGAAATTAAAVLASNMALWTTYNPTTLGGELNAAAFNVYQVNGSILAPVPTAADGRQINVIVSADDKVVYSGNLQSLNPYRLPDGFKAQVWEFTFSGNSALRAFTVATSISELKGDPI